jgi:hypothetical protein
VRVRSLREPGRVREAGGLEHLVIDVDAVIDDRDLDARPRRPGGRLEGVGADQGPPAIDVRPVHEARVDTPHTREPSEPREPSGRQLDGDRVQQRVVPSRHARSREPLPQPRLELRLLARDRAELSPGLKRPIGMCAVVARGACEPPRRQRRSLELDEHRDRRDARRRIRCATRRRRERERHDEREKRQRDAHAPNIPSNSRALPAARSVAV